MSKAINDSMTRIVLGCATLLGNMQGSKVGSKMTRETKFNNYEVVLWGFHAQRDRIVVEVSIDGKVMDKYCMKKEGGKFVFIDKTVNLFTRWRLIHKVSPAALGAVTA